MYLCGSFTGDLQLIPPELVKDVVRSAKARSHWMLSSVNHLIIDDTSHSHISTDILMPRMMLGFYAHGHGFDKRHEPEAMHVQAKRAQTLTRPQSPINRNIILVCTINWRPVCSQLA